MLTEAEEDVLKLFPLENTKNKEKFVEFLESQMVDVLRRLEKE